MEALQGKQLPSHSYVALDDSELDTLAGNHGLDFGATLDQDLCCFDFLRRKNRDRALGDDARLLTGNLHDRVTEILTMVEPDRRHDIDQAIGNIRGIPGAAHSHLDNRHINGRIREGCESQCSHHLEEGERDATVGH